MQISNSLTKKLSGLDHLRGLAIVLVLVYHLYQSFFRGYAQFDLQGLLQYPESHPRWTHWFNELHIGVNLFFVISGFLMHHIYGNRETGLKEALRFLEKRFLRIAPPYYVAILVSVAGALFLGKGFDLTGTWWHFLFIHNFSDYYSYSIQAVFWSIAVEIQFYVLFALLLILRPKNFKPFWFVVFLAFLVLSLVLKNLAFQNADDLEVLRWQAMDNTLMRFPEFLIGVLASKYGEVMKRKAWLLLAFIPAFLGHNWFMVNYFTGDLLYAIGFAGLLLLFAQREIRSNWLSFSGRISYTMYLYHFLIYSIWDVALCRIFGIERVASWIRLPIFVSGILVVYIVSYFFFRLIEKPSLRLKNLISVRSNDKN